MGNQNNVSQFDEEAIYAAALAELKSGTMRPGLWAKAFANSEGDENKSKALYIKLRVQQERERMQQEQKAVTPSQPISVPGDKVTISTTIKPMSGPSGVGGWLLFFCVLHTILAPIISVVVMASRWERAEPTFVSFPSLEAAIIFANVQTIAILVYGFVVGRMIWSGNLQGHTLARHYLLIRLFWSIGVGIIAILIMPDLPNQRMSAVTRHFVVGVFLELSHFLPWWFYFKKSKRVRNTYGE